MKSTSTLSFLLQGCTIVRVSILLKLLQVRKTDFRQSNDPVRVRSLPTRREPTNRARIRPRLHLCFMVIIATLMLWQPTRPIRAIHLILLTITCRMDPHQPSNRPTTPILLVLGMALNLTMMMFRQTQLWLLFLTTITFRMPHRRLSYILTTPILSVLSIALNLNIIMFLYEALLNPLRATRFLYLLPKIQVLFKEKFTRMINQMRIFTTPILSVLSIALNLNIIMFLYEALLNPLRATRFLYLLPKI